MNCTVHSGFYASWLNTRWLILSDLEKALRDYPSYQLVLVGHSLGGAVAALASLDFDARGWDPQITTFGEPRLGNDALMKYVDTVFDLQATTSDEDDRKQRFRRVTHIGDPVPLLPLKEWGYKMHAGEIFISKSDLYPTVVDLQHCTGNEDPNCIAGDVSGSQLSAAAFPVTAADAAASGPQTPISPVHLPEVSTESKIGDNSSWALPPRFRFWQLFFAHRDYFWRLGLCVPGGDPRHWWGGVGGGRSQGD